MASASAVAGTPSSSGSGRPWILSPGLDGAFIIGAPFLVLPALFALAEVVDPVVVAGLVLVVLSTAHHLPGFLRVYGDPVLFERYKMRFLVIPPVVIGLVWWLTWYQVATVLLISLVWAVWHGLMQVYGVMRIYGAKAGERSALTPKLDRAMCLTGFLAVLLSGSLVKERIVAAAEGTGLFGVGWLLGPTAFHVALGAFALVAVAYVVHHVDRWRKGLPVSRLKLVTLAVSLAYVAVCWAIVGRSLLLGLAAFEAFHDVQYMAIAWAYNERLAASGSGNRMLNFLFRRRRALVALYGGVILLYGGIAWVTMGLSRSVGIDHVAVALIAAFVASSGILHFYFDGFIWKVRQAKTQRDLGIEGAGPDTGLPLYSRPRELVQVALLVLPLVGLGVLALHRDAVEVPIRRALAESFPGSARLQLDLGSALEGRGRLDAAIAAYGRAAAQAEDPAQVALAHYGMGSLHAARGRPEQAVRELRLALEADPTRMDAAVRLGNLLIRQGDADGAEQVLRAALEHAPESAGVNDALARALLMDSSDPANVSEAAHLALAATQASEVPRAPSLVTLARARAARGEYGHAVSLLKEARDAPDAQADPGLRRQILRLLADYMERAGAASTGG